MTPGPLGTAARASVYPLRSAHSRVMGLRDKLKQTPPNLRRGNAKKRCALCMHFDGKGMCMKYGARVRPAELCDAFSKRTMR